MTLNKSHKPELDFCRAIPKVKEIQAAQLCQTTHKSTKPTSNILSIVSHIKKY